MFTDTFFSSFRFWKMAAIFSGEERSTPFTCWRMSPPWNPSRSKVVPGRIAASRYPAGLFPSKYGTIRTWVMNWLKLPDNCATPASSMENRLSARRSTLMSPGVWDGEVAAACGAPGAATGDGGMDARTLLPTGRISSISRSLPRLIHALSRSTEERIAPGSTSSISRNAFGCFIPFAHRIARRAAGLEETIVPTRTNADRGAWEADFALAAGSLDGNFMPCAGAKRLVHCSGGFVGTPRSAVTVEGRATAFGAYARRERYLDNVMPREPAATTMEIPNTTRYAGFRIHSPEERI